MITDYYRHSQCRYSSKNTFQLYGLKGTVIPASDNLLRYNICVVDGSVLQQLEALKKKG